MCLSLSKPDPTTATTKRRGEKFVVLPIFVASNFTQLRNITYIFEQVKKKNLSQFIIVVHFTQKLSLSSQKYWFGIRDPGTG
jgi:hypothetical protein